MYASSSLVTPLHRLLPPPGISHEVTAVICAFIHVICGSVLETCSKICGWGSMLRVQHLYYSGEGTNGKASDNCTMLSHPMSWKRSCRTWRFPVLIVMRRGLLLVWWVNVARRILAGRSVSQWQREVISIWSNSPVTITWGYMWTAFA